MITDKDRDDFSTAEEAIAAWNTWALGLAQG